MRNFLSRAEADEICDGLMERYHEEKGVSCVDIDGFVKDVLRCPVFYEAFAEKDLDKIGFCGDGISKLKVYREGKPVSVVFPRRTVSSMDRNPARNAGCGSSSPNKQYEYDHRYDSALFMDKAFRDRKLAVLKTAYEQYKTEAGLYAGPAVIETFGEAGFQPVNKPEAWAFTEKQQKLYLEYRNLSMPVVDEYVPGDETSFTLIAFPVPAIGADFEEIFKETIRINTLDYDLYRDMQQKLIDALDQAEYAEIKGRSANCTDLRVRLHPLKDPKTQTKFENCVADVNIPVGEVFTSPVLEGTEGVLNVGTVYIGEIQYKNLKLRFENGRVAEVQGIMGGHESLPLGEFAIGTNTTA